MFLLSLCLWKKGEVMAQNRVKLLFEGHTKSLWQYWKYPLFLLIFKIIPRFHPFWQTVFVKRVFCCSLKDLLLDSSVLGGNISS